MSDFSGSDPLIHRRNVTKIDDLGIRTSRNDAKFLNEPQFVGSFKDDKVSCIYRFRDIIVNQNRKRTNLLDCFYILILLLSLIVINCNDEYLLKIFLFLLYLNPLVE